MSRTGSQIWRSLRELGLLGTALLLAGDAATVVIVRPSPARVGGCYTILELLVGVSAPSLIRPTEFFLGIALLLGALWKALRGAWTVLRRGRATPLQRPGE